MRMHHHTACAIAMLVTAAMIAPGALVPAPVHADHETTVDCTGDLGDPPSGSPEWVDADLNNQQCAVAGIHLIQNNPAVVAAMATNSDFGEGYFGGDPFRSPHRWGSQRGSYELTSFTDRNGLQWSAALFGPPVADAKRHPGVLIACHVCALAPTVEHLSIWYWAAQALAESGYVVMYANTGSSAARAIDATDFFVATPDAPSPHGGFNPWHTRVDRDRLGIAGHSGAAGVALNVGHNDTRYDAIVAWDPAGSTTLTGVTPRIPTMIQLADYRQELIPPARPEKPVPALPKFTFFDTISDAGIDTMQVTVRASTHHEWSRFPSAQTRPHSIYGEMVALYYTLAWFDRYLAPSRLPSAPARNASRPMPQVPASPNASPNAQALSLVVATDALRRLTASGTDRFDRSADLSSIGAGFFDAGKAAHAGDIEAGNVPITIGGIPIRNLLSFHFESRYFFDGGARTCADMRTGCP